MFIYGYTKKESFGGSLFSDLYLYYRVFSEKQDTERISAAMR